MDGEALVRLGEAIVILDLHRQGMSAAVIARRIGLDPKVARRYSRVAGGRRTSVQPHVSHAITALKKVSNGDRASPCGLALIVRTSRQKIALNRQLIDPGLLPFDLPLGLQDGPSPVPFWIPCGPKRVPTMLS